MFSALNQRRVALVLLIAATAAARAQAEPGAVQSAAVVSLDGTAWLVAKDPQNVGRKQKWWEKPAAEARPAKVPGILQKPFPAYHGVAWYWREVSRPAASWTTRSIAR